MAQKKHNETSEIIHSGEALCCLLFFFSLQVAQWIGPYLHLCFTEENIVFKCSVQEHFKAQIRRHVQVFQPVVFQQHRGLSLAAAPSSAAGSSELI